MELQIECPPTWHPGSKILILGEAPGEDEVQQGEGWVGKAGKLMGKMLGAAGLSWEEVSKSNVAQRRPPGNDFKAAFYQTLVMGRRKVIVPTEELIAWRERVWDDIGHHRPHVVVACGNEALITMVGYGGITKRRGSAWEVEVGRETDHPWSFWVMGMLHPAALFHGQGQREGERAAAQWEEVTIGAHILSRVKWLSQHPNWRPRTYEVVIGKEQELQDFLGWVDGGKSWVLDLETIPGDGEKEGVISVLGLASEVDGKTRALVVPWPSLVCWDILRPWALQEQSWLAGHNFLYDAAWLDTVGIVLETCWLDTMQAWHAFQPELPKALEFAAMWLLGMEMPFWKDEGKKLHKKKRSPAEEDMYYRYNAKDTVATLWVAQALTAEGYMWRRDEWVWYRKNWEAALEMQRRGVVVDQMQTREVLTAVVREQESVDTQIHQETAFLFDATGLGSFNPDSAVQVIKLMYDTLGLPVQMKGKNRTADDAALQKLFRETKHPMTKLLMDRRKLVKVRRDYVESLLG